MQPLPLGKDILKIKNDFCGLISMAERDIRNSTVLKYSSQI